MMSKYPKLKDGESFTLDLNKQDLSLACCDCGKVHIFQFHHIRDNIWDFTIFSNQRATGQLRRHKFGKFNK